MARVDGEEAGAVADTFEDMVEEDRMGLPRVRPPEDDEVGVLCLFIRTGAASGSEDRRQTDDAGGVSGAVAGVDVVGADDLAGELLGEVVDLVGGLGAGEEAEGGGALFRDGLSEARGGAVEGLVPRGGNEGAFPADQGLGEADVGWRHRTRMVAKRGEGVHCPQRSPGAQPRAQRSLSLSKGRRPPGLRQAQATSLFRPRSYENAGMTSLVKRSIIRIVSAWG